MRNRMPEVLACLVALAALGASFPTLAEEDESPTTASSQAATVTPVVLRANPLRVKAIDNAALAQRRGGTDVSEMKLSGVVANNQAINVSSGNNLISDGALSNSSGLPMVIQNSGSNVLIQNATIVNVRVN